MRKAAIVGIGSTKYGELWNRSLEDLAVEAGIKALEDAGMEGEEIEAVFCGNMGGGEFTHQEHLGALLVDRVGLVDFYTPGTRIEAACASGGVAFHLAILAIASGYYDVVVAAGAEKMTDVSTLQATQILMSAADRETEGFAGFTFPALYAVIKRLHMEGYGTTDEQCALVSVKNHRNAMNNPLAHFHKEYNVDDILNSRYVAEPLHFLECSPISDGAAAVILVSEEIAQKITDNPVWVIGSAQACDTLALQDRKDITTFQSTVRASKKAYHQAGILPKDVDVCEVHDAFTIAEIIAIEGLGFVPKGQGGKATEEGLTTLDGEIAVNPSGGLKAGGHPVGATGIKQICEIVTQLRGDGSKRQVKDAEIGLTHNVGGSGATCVVNIFKN